MPEAFVIRARATRLSNTGKITRKDRRKIVDRLAEHGAAWVDDDTLKEKILAGFPGHVVAEVLNGPAAAVRR